MASELLFAKHGWHFDEWTDNGQVRLRNHVFLDDGTLAVCRRMQAGFGECVMKAALTEIPDNLLHLV